MPYHIANDGCRIFFDQRGAGPDLFMIPGLGGESAFWKGVADRLAENHRLTMIDHRGAGQSDRPPNGYSIPRIAADVVGVMDELGLGKADILGHSTGGMIAQTIASSHPDRVRALVLSGAWARRDLRFQRMFEARLALLMQAGPVAYHKLTQALGYDATWMENNRAALDAELDRATDRMQPLDVQAQRIAMLLQHDTYEALPGIRVPVLVIGAEDDALIPFSASRELANRIPGARLAQLTGGHFFPRAYPEPYATIVADFLKGLGK